MGVLPHRGSRRRFNRSQARSADFGLDEHALGNDVIAGITAAQAAVTAEDAAALDAAAEQTRCAINRIFALAVKKYAAEGEAQGEDGATARAEGLAFSGAWRDSSMRRT